MIASVHHLFKFVLVSVAFVFLVACGGSSKSGGSSGGGAPIPVAVSATHPPLRTRYRRTDIQYSPNALQSFPPHLTVYDGSHERFFFSNTTLNRIDVFDAATESQISSINLPEPWGIDISPDSTKLYVATAFGDVYLCDPDTMQIVHRYPSSTIGPQGYIATQIFVLSGGQLVLLGAMGGAYSDGSQTFAIWNTSNNSLQVIHPDVFAASFVNIGQITLTADRTKVLIASADGGPFVLYDPTTNVGIAAQFAGTANEILPTPDGKIVFLVGPQGGITAHDQNTLAQIGSFQPPAPAYGGALNFDGSTLFTVDLAGNVYAFDTTNLTQTGWVSSFQVLDLQSAIVPSVVDPSGLMIGPMGHGVGFLDTTQVNAGVRGTQFSLSFLAPSFGSLTGGDSIEANVLPAIQQPTVYIGNAATQTVTTTSSSLATVSPKSTITGAVDFTVLLPDKSVAMMPENFSYGPTIVEVSTNASSVDGGGQGVIFGYGFGQQASDAQVTIGGQSATVTQVLASASPTFPYPFSMQAVLFSVPAGTTGNPEDVTVTTVNGSATASGAFHYVAPVQTYPLQGSSLMQGIYDPYRAVVYFTDGAEIQVFSITAQTWLPPIALPNTSQSARLVGISLSPDGNTLAVSDPGDNTIYVLNPASPTLVKSFPGVGIQGVPYGLAATNSGIVYFGTYAQSISPPGGLGKLDSNSGKVVNFPPGTLEDGDAFMRVLLSPDGAQLVANEGGYSWILNTSNDSLSEGIQVSNAGDGSEELALSGDGTVALTSGMITDGNLNVASDLAYVDRDVWLPVAVLGQKLNQNGTSAYQPLTNGIDVLDGSTGLLKYRVTLPIELANVYDSLAIDNSDQLLFAITTAGIAQIDLTALPASSHAAFPIPRAKLSNPFMGQTRERKKFTSREWIRRPMLRHERISILPNSSAVPPR